MPPDLLDKAIAADEGRAFLSHVIEPLGDRFDPRLCETYASLFMDVIYREAPEIYQRIRRAPITPLPETAERVYVLSRITLGADVAVTSVLMDAAKRRYPRAPIVFVGPRKNFELFQADPRVSHMEAPYARSGSLRSRLEASASLWIEDGLVLDPDSRLTQLGLIQVALDESYCFFESRSFGKNSLDRLPDLAAQWMQDPQAKPYVAPLPAAGEPFDITVSLGVGENLSKRVSDEFELELMQLLGSTGKRILVDLGGSAEERERVQRALQPGVQTHDGAFAPFAAEVMRSKLFVGYDSAAGHVASAAGVPLISIATGFATERMAARWRPLGTVLKGDQPNLLEAVKSALFF